MQIYNDFEMASAKYLVALRKDEVKDTLRKQIKELVADDASRMVSIFNTIIVAYSERVLNGKATLDLAVNCIGGEYDCLGFGDFCPFEVLRKPLEACIGKANLITRPREEKIQILRGIWDGASDCNNESLRMGLQAFCLRLIIKHDLIYDDMEFTQSVVETLNDYSDEKIAGALVPDYMMAEM